MFVAVQARTEREAAARRREEKEAREKQIVYF